MRERLLPEAIEVVPERVMPRISEQLLMGDEPALLAGAEPPDEGLEAIVLDVDRGDEDSHAGGHVGAVALDPGEQGIRVHGRTGLLPRLPEHRVDPRPELEGVLLRL